MFWVFFLFWSRHMLQRQTVDWIIKWSQMLVTEHSKKKKSPCVFHPVFSASLFFQKDGRRLYTIKHICIGSYSRGCTFTICSCYGNPFSLQVSGDPLIRRGRETVPIMPKRGRSLLSANI